MSEQNIAPNNARSAALRKAYQQATNELRAAHQREFNDLYSKAAEALGEEWKPRPTPEEREREQLRELAAKYPDVVQADAGQSIQ